MQLTMSVFHSGGPAVQHLASLTDSTPPDAPVLVAALDGEPVAAVGLVDGQVVSDPARADRRILSTLRLYQLGARTVVSIWGA